MEVLFDKAITTPPTPMIGAYRSVRGTMTKRNWICVISFVVRVMREAVENWSNSPLENEATF